MSCHLQSTFAESFEQAIRDIYSILNKNTQHNERETDSFLRHYADVRKEVMDEGVKKIDKLIKGSLGSLYVDPLNEIFETMKELFVLENVMLEKKEFGSEHDHAHNAFQQMNRDITDKLAALLEFYKPEVHQVVELIGKNLKNFITEQSPYKQHLENPLTPTNLHQMADYLAGELTMTHLSVIMHIAVISKTPKDSLLQYIPTIITEIESKLEVTKTFECEPFTGSDFKDRYERNLKMFNDFLVACMTKLNPSQSKPGPMESKFIRSTLKKSPKTTDTDVWHAMHRLERIMERLT